MRKSEAEIKRIREEEIAMSNIDPNAKVDIGAEDGDISTDQVALGASQTTRDDEIELAEV